MMSENSNLDKMNDVLEGNQREADEVTIRKKEIKNEDGSKIGGFIVLLSLSGISGGFIGAFGMIIMNQMEKSGMTFLESFAQVQRDFTIPAAFIMIGADLIFILLSLLAYLKAKKLWNSNMDEDEKYEKADHKLSVSLILTNVLYFVNFAFFGFAFYTSMDFSDEGLPVATLRMVNLIVFIITLFAGLAIQKACVNLTKLMNPEKKGSVYDTKFDKVWYESCDEAERMQIGIASYQAFKVTNNILMWLMVVFVCGGMFFEIGILPILVIALVAIVMNVTYGIASIKAGKSSV